MFSLTDQPDCLVLVLLRKLHEKLDRDANGMSLRHSSPEPADEALHEGILPIVGPVRFDFRRCPRLISYNVPLKGAKACMDTPVEPGRELERKLRSKTALIGVIGLGYVGLPICVAASEVGFTVLGLDIDTAKADAINRGQSYLKHIPTSRIVKLVERVLSATADFARCRNPMRC